MSRIVCLTQLMAPTDGFQGTLLVPTSTGRCFLPLVLTFDLRTKGRTSHSKRVLRRLHHTFETHQLSAFPELLAIVHVGLAVLLVVAAEPCLGHDSVPP